jgi:two-component system LytT family sensor kinase
MQQPRSWQRNLFYHFLVWLILFAGWYYFRAGDFPLRSLALKVTAVKIGALALLVYLTNYVLIPKLLYQKKYFLFGSLFLIAVAGIGALKIVVNEKLLTPYFGGSAVFSDIKERVYDNIIPLLLLTSTGAAIKLVMDYVQTQRRLLEISREKAETELKFLKSQINPHFLFNSLNAIYFLIDRQNTDARQTLLQFSDLLRYQLYDCNADTIEIEKEVAYLKDYIRLQQLRKDHTYKVDVDAEPLQDFRIVPLLLVPFVENAFKHISHHNDGGNFVSIKLFRKENVFYFRSENSADPSQKNTESRSGIGLTNVQRRLDLLYPGKHILTMDRANGNFTVELQLTIG